jgi:2-iminobutanoate/2-iminopropanoate deaminase
MPKIFIEFSSSNGGTPMGIKEMIQAKGIRSAGGRPYSPALKVGDYLYIAGQVPIDAGGKTVGAGDALAQGQQVLKNIKTLVEASGGTMDDIVRLLICVTDIRHYFTFLDELKKAFNPPYPAMTTICVAGLVQQEWCIEIEAIAYLGK